MRFEDEIGQEATIVGAPVFNTRILPKVKVSAEESFFAAVIAAAEQAYRQGLPIEGETICRQNANLLQHQVEQLLSTSKFARALEDRGITVGVQNGVTGEQANFLRIYFDPNLQANNAKRMRLAGVTQAKLDGWHQQEGFSKRFGEIAHDLLRDSMPIARQRVVQGIDKGDLSFIKFGMELTGDYDPRGGPAVDVMAFARLMQDVLAQEISTLIGGPEVLRRIGARMQLVMQNRPDDLPAEIEAVVVPDKE